MSAGFTTRVVTVLALALAACAPEASTTTTNAPKTAPVASADANALCEHKVPAALCTRHHPELVPVFKSQDDWCETHGVPMSHCFAHDPQLSFTTAAGRSGGTGAEDGDWCKEHGVDEAHCTKCHPALVAKFIAAGDYCREHGFPASVCPICHPELPAKSGHAAPTFPDPGMKVRLASTDTAKDAGIQTSRVAKRTFSKTLEVTGQLEFDGNAQAQVSTKDDARVLEVLVDVGDDVKAGQAVIVLASAAAGADRAQLSGAAARLESAKSALARLEQLKGITAQKTIDEARMELATAEAAFGSARATLNASGADIGASTGGRLVLMSPRAGTVVAREAIPGRIATAGAVLVHVANTKTLWATLDVPEEESTSIRAGQGVELRFDGLQGEARTSKIAKVGASIDVHTRTVRARVDVENGDGRLKAGLFLRALIAVTDEREALLVPRAAVQRAEGRSIVFIAKEPGVYQPAAVTLGESDGDQVEILTGLGAGDEIVTTGAFLLKTEILKDSIGAGCCDDD